MTRRLQQPSLNATDPINENIETIARIEKRFLEARSTSDRVADAIAGFSGSMTFVGLHAVGFLIYIIWNLGFIPHLRAFDPYPFMLLSMVVSLEAIFLSTFVLIKENRMSQRADQRASLDLPDQFTSRAGNDGGPSNVTRHWGQARGRGGCREESDGTTERAHRDREAVVSELGMGPDACIDAVGMEAHGTTMSALYDRAKQSVRLETDRPNVLRQTIQACRKGGTVSIPGVYGGFIDKVPIGAAFSKGLTLKIGQTHVQRYMVPLLERIRKNKIDPSFVITHKVKLDEAPEAYDIFEKKQNGCIKVVMSPQ